MSPARPPIRAEWCAGRCGTPLSVARAVVCIGCHEESVKAAVEKAAEEARQAGYDAGYQAGKQDAVFGVGEIT